MPKRPLWKRALCAVAVAVTLSSCQLTVQIDTKLDGKGGGTFGVGMIMDAEARRQIENADAKGMTSIRELYAGLREKGWTVSETESNGGLAFKGTRVFESSTGFDAALSELQGARANGRQGFANIKLNFDYSTTRSFLKTRSEFRGQFHTATDQKMDPAVVRLLQDVVRFEVRAEMPGAVSVADGGGIAGEGSVVWRPALGTDVNLSATGTALRTGSIAILIIPSLLLLAVAAWFATGRRKRPLVARAILLETPEPAATRERVTVALEPEPVDQLPAIERSSSDG